MHKDRALLTFHHVMNRRRLLQSSAAGAAAAAFGRTGLAGAQEAASPAASPIPPYDGGPVTITYGFWDTAQQAGIEQQIAAFNERFPEIIVEPQIVPWGDYWTQLQTSVAGGETFDVFWMNAASLPVYASAGALASINGLLADGSIDPSNYPQPLVDMYAYQGLQYGIPRDYDTIALFYNRDIFDEAGMDYPDETWTWDDLRSAAEQLTDEGAGQWGIGLQFSWQENYYNFIFQNEGRLLSEDLSESVIDEPEAAEAIEYVTNFFLDGLTPSVAIQQSNPVAETLFPAGQVAMMPGGSFRASTYAEAEANIDVAPLPQGRRRATVIHGLANVIWSGTPNRAAAMEFVRFLAGEEAARILGESGIGLPAYEGMEGTWLESEPDMNLQVFVDAADYGVQLENPEVGFEWQVAIQEVMLQGWSGEIPVEEIPVRAKEAADAALAGGQ